jgi:hypothetical protein
VRNCFTITSAEASGRGVSESEVELAVSGERSGGRSEKFGGRAAATESAAVAAAGLRLYAMRIVSFGSTPLAVVLQPSRLAFLCCLTSD